MSAVKLSELHRLCSTMDIEPESKRAIDYPFMPDDIGESPWWYVTDTTGEKLIACANEEHAEFVAAAIVSVPVLIEIVDTALAWRSVNCDDKDAAAAVVVRMLAALAKVRP